MYSLRDTIFCEGECMPVWQGTLIVRKGCLQAKITWTRHTKCSDYALIHSGRRQKKKRYNKTTILPVFRLCNIM
uniref:Uncharacterized protein n=1 Tax=Arion vulgaris TaxID=1028688 RepID=A0A0B7B7Y6_9EUPU